MRITDRRVLRAMAGDLARHGRNRWHWWHRGVPIWAVPETVPAPARLLRRRRRTGAQWAGDTLMGGLAVAFGAAAVWCLLGPVTRLIRRIVPDGLALAELTTVAGPLADLWHEMVHSLGGPAVLYPVACVAALIVLLLTGTVTTEQVGTAGPALVTIRLHRRAFLEAAGRVLLLAVPVFGVVTFMLLLRDSRGVPAVGWAGDRWDTGTLVLIFVVFLIAVIRVGRDVLRYSWARYLAAHLVDVARLRVPPRRLARYDALVATGTLVAERGGYRFADPCLAAELLGVPSSGDVAWRSAHRRAEQECRPAAAARAWRVAAALGDPDAPFRLADLESRRLTGPDRFGFLPFVRTVRARQLTGAVRADPEFAADIDAWTGRFPARLRRRFAAGLVTDPTTIPTPFSGTVLTALNTAATEAAAAGVALGTGRVLGALIRADPYAAWQRIWPYDPMSGQLLRSADDDGADDPVGTWNGTRMTPVLARSLDWMKLLAYDFEMLPVPAALLTLALLRHPGSGARRVVARMAGTAPAEVLNRVHDDLLRADNPEIRRR